MSLVRWGQDGSQVYVYNDCAGGIRCCCGKGGFVAKDDAEMKAHLIEHKKKDGYKIPGWVFRILDGKESKMFYENVPAPTAGRGE